MGMGLPERQADPADAPQGAASEGRRGPARRRPQGHRRPGRIRGHWPPAFAVLAAASLLAGCGAAAMPNPGAGSGATGGRTAPAKPAAPGTSGVGGAAAPRTGAVRSTVPAGPVGQQRGGAAPTSQGAVANPKDPAARYAAYYRPNGTVTVTPGRAVQMQASDFAFSPNTLTVLAGKPVRLQISNVATEAHNFDLPSQRLDVNLPARTTTAITFTPTAPGTFYFYCNLPGHAAAGMVGKLVVR
jgi:uncharacterized cupredoxin-like copper-binding protein